VTLNDAILAATGGPTVNDGLRAYYFSSIGSPPELQNASLGDLERRFLRQQMPAAQGTTNDLWMEYLIGGGVVAVGTLNDMQRQYWEGLI
jgi:hypothetical protein